MALRAIFWSWIDEWHLVYIVGNKKKVKQIWNIIAYKEGK